jgi:carnitine O-acetyltransferase
LFGQTFFSEAPVSQKIDALRKACTAHTKLTKECSMGLGQDRHLYALYCLLQREINELPPPPDEKQTTEDGTSNAIGDVEPATRAKSLPSIFTDNGWNILNTSIISTSNCGNSALRLFGFGPVTGDGYGLGYIIKDDGISV